MAVRMKGESTSPTSVDITHESGRTFSIIAPKDNGGDGSSFSPTDLCAVSLGACATMIMTMFAANKGIPVDKIGFELVKEMKADPRRLGRITVAFKIATACSEVDFKKIVAAGKTCPVRVTLQKAGESGGDLEIVESYERA
jgi:uncharacterized OsmC-like protein